MSKAYSRLQKLLKDMYSTVRLGRFYTAIYAGKILENEKYTIYKYKTPKDYENERHSSRTNEEDPCIVQLINGSIVSMPYQDLYNNDKVLAILAFPDKLDIYYDSATDTGYFSEMHNLIYISTIPSYVKDIRNAFTNCSNLDCPIFISKATQFDNSTLAGCTDMKFTIQTYE